MHYHFDFLSVLSYDHVLLHGVLVTLELIVVGGVAGSAVGVLCAWIRTHGPAVLRAPVSVYVEAIRNTPFLIQLFFIFFGLPSIGVKMTEMEAALLAMVINLGAYSAEIIRAGIEAVPHGQIEAAQTLAMTQLQVFRHVVLKPALKNIWPALSSQVVLVMLGSAVCSQIAVQDLSYAADFIQSRNFRAFESYFIVTGIYLVLAIMVRYVMRVIGNLMFARRVPR